MIARAARSHRGRVTLNFCTRATNNYSSFLTPGPIAKIVLPTTTHTRDTHSLRHNQPHNSQGLTLDTHNTEITVERALTQAQQLRRIHHLGRERTPTSTNYTRGWLEPHKGSPRWIQHIKIPRIVWGTTNLMAQRCRATTTNTSHRWSLASQASMAMRQLLMST